MTDIERLLREADRPRELTDDELHRMRATLGLETELTERASGDGDSATDEDRSEGHIVSDIGLYREHRSTQRQWKSRLLPVVASAAAAVLLLMFVIGNTQRDESNVVIVDEVADGAPSSTPSPTSDPDPTLASQRPVLSAACTGPLQALTDGIVQWDGFDRWAGVNIDLADPDLLRLTQDAVLAFAESSDGVFFEETATALDAALAEAADSEATQPNQASALRTAAVKEAALTLAVGLGQLELPARCDLPAYEAALSLPSGS